MSIKSDLVEAHKVAMQRAAAAGDPPPTKLLLTLDDESELERYLVSEGGSLADRIGREGIKKALPTFSGLEVKWGQSARGFE